MRPLALSLLFFSNVASAQTALEAAKPSMATPQTAAPQNGWIPLLIVVCVVFGLYKWIGPKALSWMGSKVHKTLDSELKVHESASIGQGHLYVVTIRERTLLIGATLHSINLITELPKEEQPVAFFEHLDHAVAHGEETPVPFSEPASDRLKDLISRLTS